jgi:uncharacterized protein
MSPLSKKLLPIRGSDRLQHLDLIRGVAILGILILNIKTFGGSEVLTETPYGVWKMGAFNRFLWEFNTVIFEGKMRGLFCILFGMGIVLFSDRLAVQSSKPWLLYRRMIFLILFGFFDMIVLLWTGDILLFYGLCGLLLIPFRKLKPKWLIVLGSVAMSFYWMSEISSYNSLVESHQKYLLLTPKLQGNEKLDKQELEIKRDWEQFTSAWQPYSSEKVAEMEGLIQEHDAVYQKSYFSILQSQSEMADLFLDPLFYLQYLEELMLMFFGMALYKMGWNKREVDVAKNRRLVWFCLPLGLILSIYLTASIPSDQLQVSSIISVYETGIYRNCINLSSFILLSFGYFGLLMLFSNSKRFSFLRSKLATTGQMAFTNYLFQSISCAFIFYGFGFGLYGKLTYYQLYFIVVLVWFMTFVLSSVWMRHFRIGPFEWVWKSLTYQRIISLRRAAALPSENGEESP